MVVNWANGIEAMWYDKSHLNRYLLDHKPTKMLSLEELRDPQLLGWPWRTCVQLLGWPRVMKKLRFGPCPRITRTPGTHEGLSPSPAGGADFSGAIRAGSYFCPLEGHCGVQYCLHGHVQCPSRTCSQEACLGIQRPLFAFTTFSSLLGHLQL
ncbi:hypothetical protein GH733_018863 [Mirounga leonina]|nr:hypothetical protein GH733_018863 [Mirounga leonina]